jgi:hypothetical protein
MGIMRPHKALGNLFSSSDLFCMGIICWCHAPVSLEVRLGVTEIRRSAVVFVARNLQK